MGDIPAQIKIMCPGCNTQFRLRLKKGRLPKGPIPCPRCGDDISVAELSSPQAPGDAPSDAPKKLSAPGAPETFIFDQPASKFPQAPPSAQRRRSGTAMGAPRLSHRSTPLEDDDNDLSDLEIMPGLSQSDPKSTFLGMGAGLKANQPPDEQADASSIHTTVVSSEALEQIRNAITPADESASNASALPDGPNPKSTLRSRFKTSEQDAIDQQALKSAGSFASEKTNPKTTNAELLGLVAETAEHDAPFLPDPDPTSEVPKQMVLGRIKIKQKLRKTLKNEDFDPANPSAPPAAKTNKKSTTKDADRTTEQLALTQNVSSKSPDASRAKAGKPSLAALLKKARDRKIELPAPSDRSGTDLPTPARAGQQAKSAAELARQKSAAALDRALNSLADETARAIVEKQGTGTLKMVATPGPTARPTHTRDAPAFDTGDSSMIDLLRRRVAENQQPGAASERRGSGYIRLPTAEIQDVLGQGTYRLRVEDIIYEPIDKAGLTELIKRGVLMGAAEIAQSDGDWMPLGEHPMLAELRQKMAAEAHAMLADLKPDASTRASAPADTPITPAERAGLGHYDSSADDFSDLKDSTEIATIPALKKSLPLPVEGDPNFETANSGLFADVDALRNERTRAKTQKLYSAADISLEAPPEETSAAKPAPEVAAQTEVTAPEVAAQTEVAAPEVAAQTEVAAPEVAAAPEAHADTLPSDLPDAPFEDLTVPRSGGVFKKVLAALLVLIALGLGGLFFSPYGQPYLEQIKAKIAALSGAPNEAAPAQTATPANAPKSPVAEDSAPILPAINAARSEVASAAQIDPAHLAAQQAPAADAAHLALGERWAQQPNDLALAEQYYDALIDAGRFGTASGVATEAMLVAQASGSAESAQKFEALVLSAIEKNPELGPYQPVEIGVDAPVDAAELVRAGKNNKRLELHLSKDQESAFVFNPSQAEFERDWRMSIAAWRLCQMMVCNFHIPHTRPARVERGVLERLIAEDPGASAEILAPLNWVREDGKDYLYGALVDAVGSPARFPIENISLWRPWLSPGSSDAFDKTLAEGLAPLKGLDGAFYEPLLAQAGDLTLSQLAGQLSSVLIFDYLTNNWDRFHPDTARWGTRLGLHDGALVSSANLSTFQPRASTRIKGRFDWTSRFSRATVASLRLMDPQAFSERLFPEPSGAERARLAVFWSQRELALKRIDALVSARGEEDVLGFD